MILSLGFMKMERALSKVVFPELVPPETMMFAGLTPNPSTQSHKKEAISLFNVLYLIKSMIVKGSFLNFRMVIVGPSADNGGMVAPSNHHSNGHQESETAGLCGGLHYGLLN